MLLQHVAAADYSLCTGQETSCSNTCRRQITPCAQVRRQVAATRCGDRLLHVYRSGDQFPQHVSAIDYSLCTGQETSCSNTCRRQITPCVQVRRLGTVHFLRGRGGGGLGEFFKSLLQIIMALHSVLIFSHPPPHRRSFFGGEPPPPFKRDIIKIKPDMHIFCSVQYMYFLFNLKLLTTHSTDVAATSVNSKKKIMSIC